MQHTLDSTFASNALFENSVLYVEAAWYSILVVVLRGCWSQLQVITGSTAKACDKRSSGVVIVTESGTNALWRGLICASTSAITYSCKQCYPAKSRWCFQFRAYEVTHKKDAPHVLDVIWQSICWMPIEVEDAFMQGSSCTVHSQRLWSIPSSNCLEYLDVENCVYRGLPNIESHVLSWYAFCLGQERKSGCWPTSRCRLRPEGCGNWLVSELLARAH